MSTAMRRLTRHQVKQARRLSGEIARLLRAADEAAESRRWMDAGDLVDLVREKARELDELGKAVWQ